MSRHGEFAKYHDGERETVQRLKARVAELEALLQRWLAEGSQYNTTVSLSLITQTVVTLNPEREG